MARKVERGGSAVVGETVQERLKAGDPYTSADDVVLSEAMARDIREDRMEDDPVSTTMKERGCTEREAISLVAGKRPVDDPYRGGL